MGQLGGYSGHEEKMVSLSFLVVRLGGECLLPIHPLSAVMVVQQQEEDTGETTV